mmetsp:Transcript_344/g.699  ORF Transcript_344/g.699 Transcript_344/m.699 type:complete len:306 (-) Transcript_344:450-1367(-)
MQVHVVEAAQAQWRAALTGLSRIHLHSRCASQQLLFIIRLQGVVGQWHACLLKSLLVDPLGHAPLLALDNWAGTMECVVVQGEVRLGAPEQHGIPLLGLHLDADAVLACAPVGDGPVAILPALALEHSLPALLHVRQEQQEGRDALAGLLAVLSLRKGVVVAVVVLRLHVPQHVEGFSVLNRQVRHLRDAVLDPPQGAGGVHLAAEEAAAAGAHVLGLWDALTGAVRERGGAQELLGQSNHLLSTLLVHKTRIVGDTRVPGDGLEGDHMHLVVSTLCSGQSWASFAETGGIQGILFKLLWQQRVL